MRVAFIIRSLALAGICTSGCDRVPDKPTSQSHTDSPFGNVISFAIDDYDGEANPILASGNASEKNQAALNSLRDLALKHFPEGTWVNYGPDAHFRRIRLVCENSKIELSTWHPIAESNPRVVAASYGLTSLDDQSREAFLQEDDTGYVAKRKAFDEIERRLLAGE